LLLTLALGTPDVSNIETLPRISVKGQSFVLEGWLQKKGQRGRKSWIKDYGFFMTEITADNNVNEPVWFCKICDSKGTHEFYLVNATTAAAGHLKEYVLLFPL
jgi:hypothetical protein